MLDAFDYEAVDDISIFVRLLVNAFCGFFFREADSTEIFMEYVQ